MDDPKFETNGKNPLTELSELRFEFKQDGADFDLLCLLRFGKMRYEHNGREYEVGVGQAHLRLSLEGCEKKLGSDFGDSVLEAVCEEDGIEEQATIQAGFDSRVSTEVNPSANVNLGANAASLRRRQRTQTKTHLPVVAEPNNSWRVQPRTVTDLPAETIEGTAIPSASICRLKRSDGGNRMSVVGEVNVSKSAIKVASTSGNRLGRIMSEWGNKDAIVSQILKRALQREANTGTSTNYRSVVAISRYEISEA